MKTTIDIADDLLARSRKVADQEGITLKALTEEGLRLALDRRERREPITIEPHVVTGKAPAPELAWPRLREALYGNEGANVREQK